jgi:hypothetical protein
MVTLPKVTEARHKVVKLNLVNTTVTAPEVINNQSFEVADNSQASGSDELATV